MTINNCRFCNRLLRHSFVDLGITPLSNSFLRKEELNNEEKKYPLHAFVCNNCFLVQLGQFETPENIFSNYAYFSSYAKTWLEHAKTYVQMMIKRFNLTKNHFVIEIASNDGYLLQFFKEKNVPILGIEPAENVANAALEKGIPTVVDFFGTNLAKELTKKGKNADIIIANNVLAHVPNLNDFVMGLKILLKKNGIMTIEFPHLLRLIENNQFDTIYHEHFSYFSLLTIQKIFSEKKLTVFDVQEIFTHGGSLRIFVKHDDNVKVAVTDSVDSLIKKEQEAGLETMKTYEMFQNKVEESKLKILNFFKVALKEEKKVVGYGAPAKGNTLLNFCKIDANLMKFTVDASPHKQGLFLPGTRIPIYHPDVIKSAKPDYVFILPWNLKDEIMKELDYIRSWGGKFVTPIPEVQIF